MKRNYKTAVFYGTSSGNTKKVASQIAAAFGVDTPVFDIEFAKASDLERYDFLIFGTPTWGLGDLQYDWEKFLTHFDLGMLRLKVVALFGLGDQANYPESFLDGLGLLYGRIHDKTTIIGQWPADEYAFRNSKALVNGKLVGLGLDEDNEVSQTAVRIEAWCNSLKNALLMQ
ncbi:MAG: flavodoxin [Bacteroidetes bacterium]|nr:flavodoxin [Bacteroidales bacterium]MBU1010277.1 flavodoxin [Bacteroidota bacterium]